MSPILSIPLLLPLVACRGAAVEELAAGTILARAEPRNVAILVYEGVELLDFAGPGEVFAAARGSSGRAFRVFTVAEDKRPVRSQGFVEVTPEYSIGDCPAPDILVLPGGSVPDGNRDLQEWVKHCAKDAELVMSVCNGALLLARTGLLDGLEATTHRGSLESLAQASPTTRVLTNRRFVDSGRVMTCAGVSAGIDGALHVVERLHGSEAARRTAHYMEYEWRPEELAALHAKPGTPIGEGPAFQLAELARKSGIEAALKQYRADEKRPSEWELSQAGYSLLGRGKATEARAVLELCVAAFPDSPSALDGLSEACETLGDLEAATQHAQSALAKLATPAGKKVEHAAAIQNACTSRIARLGKGDKSELRFACPPCGGGCDDQRYLAAGSCPRCGMALVERAP